MGVGQAGMNIHKGEALVLLSSVYFKRHYLAWTVPSLILGIGEEGTQIHSSYKSLLSTYCVLDTVLDTSDRDRDKGAKAPP